MVDGLTFETHKLSKCAHDNVKRKSEMAKKPEEIRIIDGIKEGRTTMSKWSNHMEGNLNRMNNNPRVL